MLDDEHERPRQAENLPIRHGGVLGYEEFLAEMKERVRRARARALSAANRELKERVRRARARALSAANRELLQGYWEQKPISV